MLWVLVALSCAPAAASAFDDLRQARRRAFNARLVADREARAACDALVAEAARQVAEIRERADRLEQRAREARRAQPPEFLD